MNVIEVNKEQLKCCIFKKSTNYSSICERREYNRQLHLSMLMAGSDQNKVRIVFNTTEGYKAVLTAVWGATEQFVLLKDGFSIPAEAVASVSF